MRIVGQFQDAITDLDALQVGDVDGKISPIKWRIRTALRDPLEELRQIAQAEYINPTAPPAAARHTDTSAG